MYQAVDKLRLTSRVTTIHTRLTIKQDGCNVPHFVRDFLYK
jgi:hypothetical protein